MKKSISLLLLVVIFVAGCALGGLSCVPTGPAINSFSASPSSISAGESSTLNWSVAGATTVNIDQGIGNVALTGSRTVTPSTTTIYTLTATNAVGMSVTATAQVIVSATSTPTPTPEPSPPATGLPDISYFTANPPTIYAGDMTTLSWAVSNATLVTIDQGVGTVGLVGTAPVSPWTTTNYTLTASNEAGWRSVTVTVLVAEAPAPPSFAVTSVTASVDPPSFTGSCPKMFSFSAVITVNGPGTVMYTWERSDGAGAPTESITFGGAGSAVVTRTWTIGMSYSGWERIRILSPNTMVSNKANFALTCGVPFAVTSVTASVSPGSYTGPCPKTFNFSAVITANGPGTVTYKWERSDGAIAPTQSITFSSAGSKTVTTTWTLSAIGSRWERLHVLAPNDIKSNKANFTLNCL